jgi:hypothetical protein
MKTILLLSCTFCLYLGNAQNINFTDSLFKGALIDAPEVANGTSFIDLNGNTTTNVDTNSDGEISISEAQNITHIDFSYLPFTDLEGLQYFTNVKTITSYNSLSTTFNFPELVNLEELTLTAISGQMVLTNFDVTGNLNLKKLDLNSGLTNNIDLSNNINLRELILRDEASNLNLNLDNLSNLRKLTYYGNLPTLDISDCIKLVEVSVTLYTEENVGFLSIDLTNQPLLVNLNISNTNITSLDLTNNPNLENVYVQNNQLQNIFFGNLAYIRNLYCENNQLTTLNLNNFQNLEVLSCANNNLTELKLKNFKIEQYIDFNNNPNLQYICCDAEQQVYIQNQALLYGNYETTVNSDCSTIGALGINTINNAESNISVFPNPTQDYLSFSNKEILDNVTVYDLNGRAIKTYQNVSKGIDVSFLEKGIYLVKINTNEQIQTLKFIKE